MKFLSKSRNKRLQLHYQWSVSHENMHTVATGQGDFFICLIIHASKKLKVDCYRYTQVTSTWCRSKSNTASQFYRKSRTC